MFTLSGGLILKPKGLETAMRTISSIRELTNEMMSLYTQGNYSDALELVEQNADHFPQEPTRITFWKMCLLSLCGRAEDVISVFRQGLDAGLWWSEVQFRDSDLEAVRDLPELSALWQFHRKNMKRYGSTLRQIMTFSCLTLRPPINILY